VAIEKMTLVRNQPKSKQSIPNLPKPEPAQKQKRICFAADELDIKTVAEFYFDDADHDPQDVGKRCFEESLRRAKRGRS
jgi:hypothetical protein